MSVSRSRERGRGGGGEGQTLFDCLNALVDRRWLRQLTALQLDVYVIYLRHADAAGVAYPGNGTLADYVGHAEAGHVRRARGQLVALGLLERVTTGGKLGGEDASRFRVKVPPWAGSAHPEGGPNPPTPVGDLGPGPCAHSVRKGGRNARTEGAQGRSTVKEPIPLPAREVSPAAEALAPPARASAVEEVYLAYPKHVGRGKAILAIRRAVKRLAQAGELDPLGFLLERTRLYAAARERVCAADPEARKYTPYPASWFNAERYADDPKEWNENRGGSPRPNPRPAHESSFALPVPGATQTLLPRQRTAPA